MSVTILRNDPCLCGSGKKYKKCCMNKENVVQIQQAKEERFSQKKHQLTEKVRMFIDSKLTYKQDQNLFTEFRNRTDRTINEHVERMFFEFWLYFFHRYENGLRGIEWFAKERASRLSGAERELVKKWASLQPKLVEAVEKRQSSIVFRDVLTNEALAVPFPSEQLRTFAPWYGTFALIEPLGDQYFFHGVNVMIAPDGIERAKRKIEKLQAESENKDSFLYDYYPEILATSIRNLEKEEHTTKEISVYKIHADLLDERKVGTFFYELEELAINEWTETKKEAAWLKNWKLYQDSEVKGDVVLADVFGNLEIEDEYATFTCYSEEARDAFLEKLGEVHLYVANVTEERESVTIPFNAEIQNAMVQLSEQVPRYVSVYAQMVGLIDIHDKIPKYDHLSLQELVEQKRADEADLWLKQMEYRTYLMIQEDFGEVEFTADYNSFRKKLGLPLSPFVTGGALRKSTVQETKPKNPKPKFVTDEEAILFESLGFTPQTFQTFYTEDAVTFFNEKTNGKGENTVRKYRNSLFDIREMLEKSAFESWAEVDDEFWEKVIVYDFFEINGPASKSHIKEFLSTIKVFTKWLEKRKKTKVAKEVAEFISKVERELLDGAELVAHFTPFHRSRSDVNDVMADLSKVLRKKDRDYNEVIEGRFQVTKKNKNSIELKDVGGELDPFTARVSSRFIPLIHEGMFLDIEIEQKNKTEFEVVDIYQVYSKEAEWLM
ncbi:SEC-C metal-binding domain-containing protein [Alkalihalobacillus sp. MEB130]|uniref:SEC-C domain-containing protein n=1 Tax=Alkalihalobacillus sp. MEB130 TaxID=2976704 RepID=UPI0028DEFC13|nr:SEC-C metal-binding domain-containing protein [Alkalihalobacillus sp. MEB130]MDT8858884.1 SEC-C metal-binding domain-containing protein [Alkalihalobacillus sp. MEB130]